MIPPMKFKYLIIAFSIIILIIILIIAFLPQMLAGPEFAANFRLLTLPLLLFMIALLAVVGIFFIVNYRLLSLLEREDWPALAYYLEQQIYVKGRYSGRKVRLLASSYLVISDYMSVLKLESKTMLARPSLVEKNVLLFGTARVLSGKYQEAAAFFRSNIDKCRTSDRQWIQWYYGFSLLLSGNFNLAQPEYKNLAANSDDALVTGLSSYFLENSIARKVLNHEECAAAAKNGRERIKKALHSHDHWKKEVDKRATDIYIAIIRKYINEAGLWVFYENQNTAAIELSVSDTHLGKI